MQWAAVRIVRAPMMVPPQMWEVSNSFERTMLTRYGLAGSWGSPLMIALMPG